MPNLAEIIDALVEAFKQLGPSGFLFVAAVIFVGFRALRLKDAGQSTGAAVVEAIDVTPMTCRWSDYDRKDLADVVERLDRVETLLVRVEERTARPSGG